MIKRYEEGMIPPYGFGIRSSSSYGKDLTLRFMLPIFRYGKYKDSYSRRDCKGWRVLDVMVSFKRGYHGCYWKPLSE